MSGKDTSIELVRAALSGRLTRREVARRAAAAGLSSSAIAALLMSRGEGAAAQDEGGTPAAGTPGGEIVVGLNLEPDNLDPAVTPFAVSH